MVLVEQRPCHRCGTLIDVSCPFCPQCGSPQLSVPQYDMPEQEAAGAGGANYSGAAVAASGAPPLHALAADGVQWKLAVWACFIVALAAGLLCAVALIVPALYSVAFFWTLSGSVIALAVYQRRAPMARLDGGTGARIGLLTGILMASALAFAGSIFMALLRYVWHKGADFDAQISDAIHQGMARAAENSPDPQLVQSSLKSLLSPEGRAGYTLAMGAFLAVLLVVFSTISGAVGAKLMPRRRAPAL